MNETIIEEQDRFLQAGPYTEITNHIEKLVTSIIEGEGEKFIEESFRWISSKLKYIDDYKYKYKRFRKRTADKIITDKTSTGCTDDALVFLVLSRAKGFPAKYLEAVRKDSDGHNGHVFVEVYIDNEWIFVDPARRKYQRGFEYNEYDIIAIGLDFGDTGTNSVEKLIEKTSKYRISHNK